ncbi:hypothetical protein [Leptospirillum ferrooxidans]|uniref:Uncharacterized protein n=1 Tax=Leptospirillum ferrooxidans (strain C2-3) TaxID=1162668 RepID=I0IRK4_LEPFC|nr:hypothetical protein [Leptospirillum ferrooxidans]BAM07903.1 hypothetical protein LFE_2230 [Leptospirillum ferrooxidans C2-3]
MNAHNSIGNYPNAGWRTIAIISPETRTHLGIRHNRFLYVHTPKAVAYSIWCNPIFEDEPTFLQHIRIASLVELKERILKDVQ